MTKHILTIALFTLATTFVPAHAGSTSDQSNGSMLLTQPRPVVQSGEVEEDKKSSTTSKLGKLIQGPKACCGAIAGVTLGVPVRVVRDVSHESKRMTGQLYDDFSPSAGAADRPDTSTRSVGTMIGMLYGVPSGIILGTIHGTTRGLEASLKKPFSKESVSLTDPK